MKKQAGKRFSQLVIVFSILLLVLGMVQALPLVVCFEPNGQVALEAATAQGVCADWQADLRPSRLMGGLWRHCLDVPLSQGKLALKAVTPMSLQWSAPVSMPGLLVSWINQSLGWGARLICATQWAQPPPLPVGVQAFLKTIILLL
jgi:hypothetical protein